MMEETLIKEYVYNFEGKVGSYILIRDYKKNKTTSVGLC